MASTTAALSLDRVSTVSNGTTVDFAAAKRNVTMIAFPTGTVTGGVVSMDASHDGTNWVTIAVLTVESRPVAFSSQLGAYRYWRASVVDSIKGGGSASATFMEADV
jgi:hypothetical protein